MTDKVTAPSVKAMKAQGRKIVCITAYDSTLGSLADEAGVDVVLVGDSLGNVLLGFSSTVPVTLEHMVHHTRATRAGVERALLVSDLPFGSYEPSIEKAMESAIALMKAGAEAVKLEGNHPDTVAALVNAGIPVMGHVGMTPQSVNKFGGFRIQGKGRAGDDVINQAKMLDEAGAFALVLELIPSDLANRITSSVTCPTIGIGAGPCCSGQIQVIHDALGLGPMRLRHAKPYIDGRNVIKEALQQYAREVRETEFPTSEHCF